VRIWVDGGLRDVSDATVSVFDHGLTVGDGVFETLKTVGRAPFAARRHLARLRRSAAALGIDVGHDDECLLAAMACVVASTDWPEARVRVTVTGGRSPLSSVRGDGPALVVIAAAPLAPREPDVAVAVVPWRRNEHGALAGVKSTSYAENVVALAYAHERGAGEAVFANTAGRLCEGTGSNVFVVVDGEVLTPPLSSGCLAGVTRDLVLETGAAREVDVDLTTFRDADEAFLTSTTRDVQPIRSIDGRPLPTVGGELTRRAMDAFAKAAAAEV
jgi:branched-chain amino acid aminotransferase